MRVHYVLYYYNPVGYAFLPHCGGKRKFSDVKAYSLYIILTYKSKPFETIIVLAIFSSISCSILSPKIAWYFKQFKLRGVM